jgi:hypothetical protein
MSEEAGERQRTYSRAFTESVFARFDALDERAQRLEMLSLSEERAFSALIACNHEVGEIKTLARVVERRLDFISRILSGILGS